MPGRKLTDEQTVQLLKAAEKGTEPLAELCRTYGISEGTYYNLRNKYGGSTTSELRRLRQLEAENARLLELVGQLTLEYNAVQEVVRKKRRVPPRSGTPQAP